LNEISDVREAHGRKNISQDGVRSKKEKNLRTLGAHSVNEMNSESFSGRACKSKALQISFFNLFFFSADVKVF
jgi:hypothetical protein